MKTLTRELWMEVPRRRAIVSIHRRVEELVAESGVQHGIALINAMHITASVFINDNESGLHADYERWLEQLVPFDAGSDPDTGGYLHNRTGEDNADAHHKRQIMGREVVVALTDGQLHLGPWEHIFYYEFDGQRSKRVLVKIIGE
ncbi:MAG: secondary thiamine-phosphate synthase enzyme YjbQ [Planctomycetaceae bacterium]